MKSRLLKKELNNTGYTCHGTDDYLCAGSPYCSDLIKYDRKKKTVKYALDTFNKGRPYLVSKGNDEILFIYDKLTELSETGEIEKFFDGDDVIDNPMTIYTYDYKTNQIIEKFTERGKCEWPNTTTSGEIIYENTHYEKREDCVESELRQQNYKIENCENRIEDYQEKLENAKAQLEEAKDFIKRETL